MISLVFSKKNRLLSRKDFLPCYDEGRKWHTPNFILFVYHGDVLSDSWRVGFAVSKKIGNAVVRNRVKRVLRECFRLNQKLLKKADIVVVPKKHLDVKALDLALAEKEILPVLKKF